ncbi:MAG: hypothetical protein J0L58_04010 [Burkholderiales bacterium]|nr:hypothetical protein [Burkholderiales bacterium]
MKPTLPWLLELLLHPLSTWTWRHAMWAAFIGAANLFCNGTPLANTHVETQILRGLVYNVLQFGVPLVWLVGVADRLVDRGLLPDALAYLGAVLLTVWAGVWFVAPVLLAPWLGVEPWWDAQADRNLAFSSFGWLLLGTMFYAQRRGNQRATQQREAAEQAQARQQRELAAAQLLALQARVDPELLFERLRAVDAELQTDPELARRRLSALIDLLRLLQPHHDARISTLAREFDSAALLARLLGRDAQLPERLLLQLPAGLQDQPFAPSVLLPLLRQLLATPGTLWRLRALPATAEQATSGRLSLQLSAEGPDAASTQAAAQSVPLAQLRERLQAVLGPDARLDLQLHPLPRFELQWPAS